MMQRQLLWKHWRRKSALVAAVTWQSTLYVTAFVVIKHDTTFYQPSIGYLRCGASLSPVPCSTSSPSTMSELLKNGTLTLFRRPEDYRDRRADYYEPEEIYILGVAHGSADSARIVTQVIEEVQPQNVVLEMCASRSGLTAAGDSQLLEQVSLPRLLASLLPGDAPLLPGLQRSVNLAGGKINLLGQYILALAIRQLSSILHLPFGQEFIAARQAAEKVGAQIVLGDRPIEITLQRAYASLSFRERLLLLVTLLTLLLTPRSSLSLSNTTRHHITFTASPSPTSSSFPLNLFPATPSSPPPRPPTSLPLQQDTQPTLDLPSILSLFRSTLPTLYHVLIHERDMYMAWASKRSKAVNGSRKVVTIVGQMHIPGLVAALGRDRGGDRLTFKAVTKLPDVGHVQGGVQKEPGRFGGRRRTGGQMEGKEGRGFPQGMAGKGRVGDGGTEDSVQNMQVESGKGLDWQRELGILGDEEGEATRSLIAEVRKAVLMRLGEVGAKLLLGLLAAEVVRWALEN